MILETYWFLIWGLLWAGYFMLDGFVIGTGALHTHVGKTEAERESVLRSFGPHWGANVVWLITAGAGTFAAFPNAYGSLFSFLYIPMTILVFSLILRGISIEFREQLDSERWKRVWGGILGYAGLLAAFILGVAFGGIFTGLPIGANGYEGDILTVLTPYGLLTGALFVLIFLVHGANWIAVKTTGEVQKRAAGISGNIWFLMMAVAVVFLAATGLATSLFDNLLASPVLFLIPLLAVGGFASSKVFVSSGLYNRAFAASSVGIVALVFTGIAGLFPSLIPSTIDAAYSITLENAGSSPYALGVMTIIAATMMPIIIGYQIWAFSIFRGKVSSGEDHGSY